jgi:DNA-binding NtrC family response regulator
MPAERSVLIVDDDKLICWALERALKKKGYAVSVLTDSTEARETLKRKDFDLVITDLRMPELDGLEVIEEVRRHSPSTSTVLMSAFGTESAIKTATEKGAYFLEKPFKIEEFVERLQWLFDR